MPRAIPGNIIEMNRLFIIAMAVATELQSTEWRFFPHMVSNNMIKRPLNGPGGTFDGIRFGATEVTGRALRVHIGALLESAIHPSDQIDLLDQRHQWCKRWRKMLKRLDAEIWILF